MGMAERGHGNARAEIEESAAVGSLQPSALASHERHGGAHVGRQNG